MLLLTKLEEVDAEDWEVVVVTGVEEGVENLGVGTAVVVEDSNFAVVVALEDTVY